MAKMRSDLAAELLALVLRRRRELELQGALAGMAEARAAEIVAGRPCRLIGGRAPDRRRR